MSLNLYHYKAEVLSVYDGDTVTLMIDQGMKHFARVKVRLIGINTPEIRTKDLEEKERGYQAKDYLKSDGFVVLELGFFKRPLSFTK